MRDGLAKLQFRRLEEMAARVVDTPRELRTPWPGVETFWWSHDGKRLLFLMDRNEDENAHLFAVDVHAAELTARDLTPLDGVRVESYAWSTATPTSSSFAIPDAPGARSISIG